MNYSKKQWTFIITVLFALLFFGIYQDAHGDPSTTSEKLQFEQAELEGKISAIRDKVKIAGNFEKLRNPPPRKPSNTELELTAIGKAFAILKSELPENTNSFWENLIFVHVLMRIFPDEIFGSLWLFLITIIWVYCYYHMCIISHKSVTWVIPEGHTKSKKVVTITKYDVNSDALSIYRLIMAVILIFIEFVGLLIIF